jgi:hypothetical protein
MLADWLLGEQSSHSKNSIDSGSLEKPQNNFKGKEKEITAPSQTSQSQSQHIKEPEAMDDFPSTSASLAVSI